MISRRQRGRGLGRIMHRQRGAHRRPISSSFFNGMDIFGFLLAWIAVVATIAKNGNGLFCEASAWSYIFGESEIQEHENNHGEVLSASGEELELVSPIVNREIRVSVKAPWPSSSMHSVLCEAFCFLKGDYSFLDGLAVNHGRDHLVTFERATEYALELAAGLEDKHEQTLRLLKVALTMRAMAPTCELHRTIAHDRYPEHVDFLESFGVITYKTMDGETAEFLVETSANIPRSHTEMPKLTKTERNALLLPDEVIRQGSKRIDVSKEVHGEDDDEMVTGIFILYTQLGGLSFATFYHKLIENKIPFVVRHMGSDDDDQAHTVLQGYGVRLDIRNVEYKVFDDDKKRSDESTQDAMINLTKLGASDDIEIDDDDSSHLDDTAGASCDSSDSDTFRQESVKTRYPRLTTHFLAGINLTALDLSDDESGAHSYSKEEMQRELWKLHTRFEQHSQLIPPTWQRRHLSIQAAAVVANSRQPLITLQDVSQNLPSMASTLVHVTVPKDINEIAGSMESTLQRLISTSGGGIWINGRPVNIERPSFNVFDMVQLLQDEVKELEELERKFRSILPSQNLKNALERIQDAFIQGDSFFTSNDNGEDNGSADNEEADDHTTEGLYRIDLASGDKDSVIYMNDLEKDRSYSSWGTSVRNMLMAMQYGMPPSIRRNLFTVLLVVDPLENETESSNTNYAEALLGQLVQEQYPVRSAVVAVSQKDINTCSQLVSSGKACELPADHWLSQEDPLTVNDLKEIKATTRDVHRLYAYVRQVVASSNGQASVMYQLYMGTSIQRETPSNGNYFSLFDLFNKHNEILVALRLTHANIPLENIVESLRKNENVSNYSYGKAVMFATNKGLKTGMSFINGRPLPANEDDSEKLQIVFSEEQQLVFKMIVDGEITDEKPRNFYYKLIKGNKKDVFPRLHPLLTEGGSANAFLDLEHNFGTDSLMVPKLMGNDASYLDTDATFLYEAFLAIDTPKGLSLALDFLKAMNTLSKNVGDTTISARYRILPSTINSARTDLCKILNSAGKLGFEKVKEILQFKLTSPDDSIDGYRELVDSRSCNDLSYLQEELSSDNFLTANGRVYNIDNPSLSITDIELLTSLTLQSTKIVSEMMKSDVDEISAFDVIGRTTAFLSTKKSEKKKRSDPAAVIKVLEKKNNIVNNPLRFLWNRKENNVRGSLRTKVTAIVDPTTETAQRLSPLLLVIRDELKLQLDLLLAPRTELDGNSDIPISSYYRFVADPLAYQARDDSTGSPMALFSNLPTDQILTLRMDVPEPWDVQQTRAIQDTDNLRCDLQSACGDDDQIDIEMHEQRHVTNVEYGLQHLLLSGQCYETNLSPPNGLQLVLSKELILSTSKTTSEVSVDPEPDESIKMEHSDVEIPHRSHYSDTLVMKTAGYWQLRANPGFWDLKIKEDSRGAEIFQMVEGEIKPRGVRVTKAISDNTKRLVIRDFVGRGNSDFLLVKRKPGYELATLFHDDKKGLSQNDDDVVHVFSLATGHLYERFLKIMMLSVTKRTSAKVKFWLFENFLSPTFKATSIAMAKRIGCEVEFVTYKWPEWLRGQSEKQRIIWGYKILFLDVLFPLNVKKIIYVDADQVIRGDLKELWNMDLKGAPYGYTPMCSSNESTLGFQFWNQGFCK
uniref:UDP-glucose:glycoprotein glucosyltransferase n=1 Tax=Pseudo-nitzschia multistriata TaxID=183589 RepID=A0A448ZD96_9STRA